MHKVKLGIAALLAGIIPMNDLSGSNFFRLDVQDNLRSYYETKFHVSIIEPYQRTVVASSECEVNVCYRIWTYRNSSASGTRIPLRLLKRRRIQVDDCDVRVRTYTERRSPERQTA